MNGEPSPETEATARFLVAETLTKSFGGVRAVDRCSLEVREGTITGLIGPNGAGKTTLFNLLTGFHRPDDGRIVFRGDDITGLPPHQVFRRGICRTFQIPREFKNLTVLENLLVVPPDQAGERLWAPWLQPGRIRREETRLREQAVRVLEQVGLARLAGEPAWTLAYKNADKLFRAAHKEDADFFASMAYDHLMVIALSVLAAKGDTAGDAIKANIRKISNPPGKVVGSWADAAAPVRAGEKVNYEGASSAVDFDEHGDVKTDFGVYRIKAGKWALDRVIKFGELQTS